MKKIISLISAILILFSFCACDIGKNADLENEKIQICTMIFCEYDFARAIAKDKADITMFIKPGAESHSFEPQTKDMIKASECDVFVYTSPYGQNQSEKILTAIANEKTVVCDTASGIKLESTRHNHEDEENEHESHGDYDPHIWTSPKNAVRMVDNVLAAIIKADPKNMDFYRENAREYIEEINALDSGFEDFFNENKNSKMIFASRFPFLYFTKEYNVEYDSAFDDCSGETEPGVKVMQRLAEEIENEDIKTVFYIEMSDERIADTLCEETGAKKTLFHSCHNVTKDEFENGETYVSLMKNNLQALKDGLR